MLKLDLNAGLDAGLDAGKGPKWWSAYSYVYSSNFFKYYATMAEERVGYVL